MITRPAAWFVRLIMAVPKNTWSTKVSFGPHHKRKISNILLNILQNMTSCSYGWRAGTVAEVKYGSLPSSRPWWAVFTCCISQISTFDGRTLDELYCQGYDCIWIAYDSISQSNHHFHKRYFDRLAGFDDYGWPSIPSTQSVSSRSVQCLVCDFSCLYLKSRKDHFSMEFYGMVSLFMMRDYFTQHNQLVW